MKNDLTYTFLFLTLLLVSCVGTPGKYTIPPTAVRIISLAPNITETLFALGLGDRVIGVTRFCDYPPEAREKPSVGGFLDPNYEMISSLHPDLVLLLPEHVEVMESLDNLGIRYEIVHDRTVAEILGTIGRIGNLCGKEHEADSLIADIDGRIKTIQTAAAKGVKPKVLISVSREFDAETISRVYAAGPGTFYDELIGFAGGENAYRGPDISYPVLSAEGLISLNPDIIIDLIPPGQEEDVSPETIRNTWAGFGTIGAVRSGQIYVLDDDYAVVPGPRFIEFLEELAGIVKKWMK
jgi:iron complex transport system substrate-binding protein